MHLCLIRVLLASPLLNPGSPRPHGLTGSTATLNIAEIVSLAEKYYDRIDAATLISMLPKQIPLAVLAKYLNTVVEYGNTKKRNLQVKYCTRFSKDYTSTGTFYFNDRSMRCPSGHSPVASSAGGQHPHQSVLWF